MRKKLVVLAAALAVFGIMGVAFAAWTADGTGDATAQAGVSQAVDVDGVVTDTLYPTLSSDVEVTVTNNNPFNVEVTEINGDGAITSGDAACDASHGVTFADASGLSVVVGANGGSEVITLTGAAAMSNDSVDACQGQTFTIPLEVVAASTDL